MLTKKINNKEVKAIPIDESKIDKRPIKGVEVCPQCFANVLLLAKKNSGKTSNIYALLQQCLGRDTNVIAFVSTLDKDPQWTVIREYCESKGVPFQGYTSLIEDGVNMLEAWIKHMQTVEQKEDQHELEHKVQNIMFPCRPAPKFDESNFAIEPETKEVAKKLKKTKYQAPEYIIIIAALSDELKI